MLSFCEPPQGGVAEFIRIMVDSAISGMNALRAE
jgi:hypothetical protein